MSGGRPPVTRDVFVGMSTPRGVVSAVWLDDKRVQMVRVDCRCGASKELRSRDFVRAASSLCRSCRSSVQATRHGDARPGECAPEHRAWSSMMQRCHNPDDSSYRNYGARGIFVFDAWRGAGGYELFLGHIGRRPTPAHSLDRIDNSRGYEPGNVRWATAAEQRRNSRQNVYVTIDGETMVATDWARRVGLSPSVVLNRLARGWDERSAVFGRIRGEVA